MKLKLLFLCMGILGMTAVNADCTLPCGVQELLDCAAARQSIPLSSGEELYNQVLFQKGDGTTPPMLDGFCQSGAFLFEFALSGLIASLFGRQLSDFFFVGVDLLSELVVVLAAILVNPLSELDLGIQIGFLAAELVVALV